MRDEVRVKLRQLKQYDKRFERFGSNLHRYRINEPASEFLVRQVEDALGVTLPESMRQFYLQLGDSDAGPHYGVFRVARLPREVAGVFDLYDTPSDPKSGRLPFPVWNIAASLQFALATPYQAKTDFARPSSRLALFRSARSAAWDTTA